MNSQKPDQAKVPVDVFKGAGQVNRPFLWAFKAVTRVITRTYIRLHMEGRENVPDEGACIVITNHLSGLDPFLIGIPLDRTIYCLAKVELYQNATLT